MAFHLKSTISLRVRFCAPSRIRTCAHGSGVHSRIQPLPARTRPALHGRGAYGTRESSSSASPSAAIDSHDPEAIRCTNGHICMSRNLAWLPRQVIGLGSWTRRNSRIPAGYFTGLCARSSVLHEFTGKHEPGRTAPVTPACTRAAARPKWRTCRRLGVGRDRRQQHPCLRRSSRTRRLPGPA
jgi:hypothetical protein